MALYEDLYALDRPKRRCGSDASFTSVFFEKSSCSIETYYSLLRYLLYFSTCRNLHRV